MFCCPHCIHPLILGCHISVVHFHPAAHLDIAMVWICSVSQRLTCLRISPECYWRAVEILRGEVYFEVSQSLGIESPWSWGLCPFSLLPSNEVNSFLCHALPPWCAVPSPKQGVSWSCTANTKAIRPNGPLLLWFDYISLFVMWQKANTYMLFKL